MGDIFCKLLQMQWHFLWRLSWVLSASSLFFLKQSCPFGCSSSGCVTKVWRFPPLRPSAPEESYVNYINPQATEDEYSLAPLPPPTLPSLQAASAIPDPRLENSHPRVNHIRCMNSTHSASLSVTPIAPEYQMC